MKGLPKWFGHVNLNVRDIARSERFYVGAMGLHTVLRLSPDAEQSGHVFEIAELVRWDGVLMGDGRGARGPVLDVLQWSPAADDDAVLPLGDGHRWGLNRLLFTAPDLDDVAARVAEQGVTPREIEFVDEGSPPVPALHLRDPDGTHIEVRREGETMQFRGVRINCSSMPRSTSYYERVLRMSVTDDHRSVVDGRAVHRRVLRYAGQRDTFSIELCEPGPDVLLPRALSPGNLPGLYRMALVTEDFTASLEHLATILPEPPRVAKVDIGAGIGMLDAVFFEDPDGAIVEFVEHGFVEVARRNQRPLSQEL